MRRIMITTVLAMVSAGLLMAGVARGDEFVDRLNVVRASQGLQPVAPDSGAAGVAAQNNQHQQAAGGVGHFFTGGLGQCAAFGPFNVVQVLTEWLSSPPHAAILLHPGLTSVGYHGAGWAHTASCSMGGSGYSMTTQQTSILPIYHGPDGPWFIVTGQRTRVSVQGPRRGFHPFRGLFRLGGCG